MCYTKRRVVRSRRSMPAAGTGPSNSRSLWRL